MNHSHIQSIFKPVPWLILRESEYSFGTRNFSKLKMPGLLIQKEVLKSFHYSLYPPKLFHNHLLFTKSKLTVCGNISVPSHTRDGKILIQFNKFPPVEPHFYSYSNHSIPEKSQNSYPTFELFRHTQSCWEPHGNSFYRNFTTVCSGTYNLSFSC